MGNWGEQGHSEWGIEGEQEGKLGYNFHQGRRVEQSSTWGGGGGYPVWKLRSQEGGALCADGEEGVGQQRAGQRLG